MHVVEDEHSEQPAGHKSKNTLSSLMPIEVPYDLMLKSRSAPV